MTQTQFIFAPYPTYTDLSRIRERLMKRRMPDLLQVLAQSYEDLQSGLNEDDEAQVLRDLSEITKEMAAIEPGWSDLSLYSFMVLMGLVRRPACGYAPEMQRLTELGLGQALQDAA